MKLKLEIIYAAECLKLSVKIRNEFFDTLYDINIKINVIIKTAVNVVKLSIQSDSIISLIVYNSRNCLFVKMCLNVKIDCREAKYYTSVFIIEKVVCDLLLERSY